MTVCHLIRSFIIATPIVFCWSVVAVGQVEIVPVDPIDTFVDRPVVFHLPIRNEGTNLIEVISVEPGDSCLKVLRYPRSLCAKSTEAIVFLLIPDHADFLRVDVTVQVRCSQERRLHSVIEGVVNEKGPRDQGDLMALQRMLKVVGVRKGFSPNVELYCAPSELEKGSLLVVDLRPESDYRKGHIAGAINVSPYTVLNKTFLRNKAVVLMDDGVYRAATEQLCLQLGKQGVFSAKILDGGVLRWKEEGRKLEGQQDGELRFLKANNLGPIVCCEKWQVVFVGTNAATAAIFLPGAIIAPMSSPNRWAQEYEEIHFSGDDGRLRILLVGDGVLSTPELQAVRNVLGPHVYSLEDGFDSYLQGLSSLAQVGKGHKGSIVKLPTVEDRRTLGYRRTKSGCGCSRL